MCGDGSSNSGYAHGWGIKQHKVVGAKPTSTNMDSITSRDFYISEAINKIGFS